MYSGQEIHFDHHMVYTYLIKMLFQLIYPGFYPNLIYDCYTYYQSSITQLRKYKPVRLLEPREYHCFMLCAWTKWRNDINIFMLVFQTRFFHSASILLLILLVKLSGNVFINVLISILLGFNWIFAPNNLMPSLPDPNPHFTLPFNSENGLSLFFSIFKSKKLTLTLDF